MHLSDTWTAQELMATIKKSHSKEKQKYGTQEERLTDKERLSRESRRSQVKSNKRDSSKPEVDRKMKIAEKEKHNSPLNEMKLRDKTSISSKKRKDGSEENRHLKTSKRTEGRSEKPKKEESSQHKLNKQLDRRKSDESYKGKDKTRISSSHNAESKVKPDSHRKSSRQTATTKSSKKPSSVEHSNSRDISDMVTKSLPTTDVLPEQKPQHSELKEEEEEDEEEVIYTDDFEDYESDFEEDLVDDDDGGGGGGAEDINENKNEADTDINHANSSHPDEGQPNKRNDSLYHNHSQDKENLQKTAIESLNASLPPMITTAFSQEVTESRQNKPTLQSSNGTENSVNSHPKISEKENYPASPLKETAKLSHFATYQLHNSFDTVNQHTNTQKVISKIKKRGETLLDLITLDETPINLFSMAPTAYDEFMLTFGNTNTTQTCIQTGDDNIPEESQTDDIEKLDLWTQYPPYLGGAVGGEFISKLRKPVEVSRVKDWKYLSKFINATSRVMCCLLEEDIGDAIVPSGAQNATSDNLEFSNKVISLPPPDLVTGCCVTRITCCKLQPHNMLVIYQTPTQADDCIINNTAFLCEWNVYQPAGPQKVLICGSRPLCCCLDGHADFAFGGMEDGSIALWDLREPSSWHHAETYKNTTWVLRAPTYSTAKVLGEEGHYSRVVAISCQEDGGASDLTYKRLGKESFRSIIQLITLEEQACLSIWVVTELSHTEPALNNLNLGLSPQGRMQLTKSKTINLQAVPSLHQHLQSFPRVLDFAINPHDTSTFYIATDMGVIVSGSVYDDKCRVFGHSQDGGGVEVTSLCFLPIGEPEYFLAGFNDGGAHLYKTSKDKPLMMFNPCDNDKPVIKIQWSTSSPNVFYVLKTEGKIHLWDLSQNDFKPVASYGSKQKKITYFDVGSDKRHINPCIDDYQPHMVIGHDDGTIKVHYLSSKFSRYGKEELESFTNFINLL